MPAPRMDLLKILIATAILLSAIGCTPNTTLSEGSESVLQELDKLIDARKTFNSQKEQELRDLREQLEIAESDSTRYDALIELTQHYRPYRFDSALLYAQQADKIAAGIGPAAKRSAQMEMAYCYLSAGLFLEAEEIIGDIERDEMSHDERAEYHLLQMKKYVDMTVYNRQNDDISDRYRQRGIDHADSAMMLFPKGRRWEITKLHELILRQRHTEARGLAEDLLTQDDLPDRERAIVLSHLGSIAESQGDDQTAIEALARSACYDITLGTHETTSMARLSNELYRQGELKRALKYIDVAMEDANFYDARHRKMAIGDIRPLIEEGRVQDIEGQRRQMLISTVTVSLLCLLLVISIIVIVTQMRRLRAASTVIVEKNQALEETNIRLNEANTIKDEYIGSSFYSQGEYIHQQEELYRFILKSLQTKQYDTIRKRLKQSKVVQERKDMYADFDRTFTHLFPSFVEGYLRLFPREEQLTPPPDGSLTPEMRIFALIRLGITKNEQIANFLNYSINTINTYKTRAKNRSVIDNKDFESEVMKIGKSS